MGKRKKRTKRKKKGKKKKRLGKERKKNASFLEKAIVLMFKGLTHSPLRNPKSSRKNHRNYKQ